MGFSHRELLRALPSAARPFDVRRLGDRSYELVADGQRIELDLQPETERVIAAIRLPVTGIHMRFHGFDQSQYDAFMYRFKKYLQRGGG